MKNFNKNTEFVCTAMDDCLYYPMTVEEVIEDYFKDPNTGEDVMFFGNNMKDLFEEVINNDTIHLTKWNDLQIYMNTINLCTKDDYIMNVFETYKLDKEDEESCAFAERKFLDAIDHNTEKYYDIVEGGDDIATDIAYVLARYGEKKFGGEWDYHWTEGSFVAWNKDLEETN